MEADLRDVNFFKALLSGASWEDADLDGANLVGAEGIAAVHLAKAKNLDTCKMDDKLRQEIQDVLDSSSTDAEASSS